MEYPSPREERISTSAPSARSFLRRLETYTQTTPDSASPSAQMRSRKVSGEMICPGESISISIIWNSRPESRTGIAPGVLSV